MRHFRQGGGGYEDENGVSHYELWLEDENGNVVDTSEVIEAFANLTATGYFVKPRYDVEIDINLPWGGRVTKVTDDEVFIEGTPVPRRDFHAYYTLD